MYMCVSIVYIIYYVYIYIYVCVCGSVHGGAAPPPQLALPPGAGSDGVEAGIVEMCVVCGVFMYRWMKESRLA